MSREIRELTFSEGLNTTSPDQRFLLAGGIVSFASSALYVTAKGTGAENGDQFYNTATNLVNTYENGIWQVDVTADSTMVLKNKTIDGDDNTVQDLPVTALKTNVGAANTFISRDGSGIPISTKSVPTGVVIGTTDTQTLTNKTFDDALTVKHIATPSNPASGYNKVYAKTDGKMYKLTSAGVEAEVGGGGAGDADTISLILASGISVGLIDLTGQNANFKGGGTITASSLSISTTAADLVFGTSVIKYSPAANGQNDYFGFTKDIPLGVRGNDIGFQFWYKNDATTVNSAFRFCVRVKDGAQAGQIEYTSLTSSSATGQKIMVYFHCPLDCTQVEFGWQNTVTTTTVQFFCDDILISASPFAYKNMTTCESILYTGYTSKDGSNRVRFKTKDTTRSNESSLISVTDSGYVWFTALKDCFVNVSTGANYSGSSSDMRIVHYNVSGTIIKSCANAIASMGTSTVSMTAKALTGDYFLVTIQGTGFDDTSTNFCINAYSPAENVIVNGATKGIETYYLNQLNTNMTNLADELEFNLSGTFTATKNGTALTYSNWQLSTQNLIYVADDSANTRTKFIASRPCEVTLSLAGNLLTALSQLTIYKNGASYIRGAAQTTAFYTGTVSGNIHLNAGEYITVGPVTDSLRNVAAVCELTITAIDSAMAGPTTYVLPQSKENVFSAKINSDGTIASKSSDWIQSVTRSATGTYAIVFKSSLFSFAPSVNVNPENNIGTVSVTPTSTGFTAYIFNLSGTPTNDLFNIMLQRQNSDYTPPGVYIGQVAPYRTVYLKDVKAAGTSGGTFTSGAWQTRTLNTIEGDTSLASLSSNQFILQPGTYQTAISVPAYLVTYHKAKLYNVTATSDTIIGTSEYLSAAGNGTTSSFIDGIFTITVASTFEIRHYCSVTEATDGFGLRSNFAVNEVYTTATITKLY